MSKPDNRWSPHPSLCDHVRFSGIMDSATEQGSLIVDCEFGESAEIEPAGIQFTNRELTSEALKKRETQLARYHAYRQQARRDMGIE